MDLSQSDWKYVGERAGAFVGREWVFAQVRSFLSGPPGTFLLRGDPGTGKTAVAARLAQASCGRLDAGDSPLPVGSGAISAGVFCRIGKATLAELAQRLSDQLAVSVGGFADAQRATAEPGITIRDVHVDVQGDVHAGGTVSGVVLPPQDGKQVFSAGVAVPLRHLRERGEAEPIVLLVDAVDEAADVGEPNTFSRLLGNLDGIHLIVTCRPVPSVLSDFSAAMHKLDLIADAPADDDDVRRYIRTRLTGQGAEEAVDVLVGRVSGEADGNFLYAFYVTGTLVESELLPHMDGKRARDLPLPVGGLSGVYEDFLDRQIAGDDARWAEELRPVLAPLAAAQGDGLTTEELGKIACRLSGRPFTQTKARDITRAAAQFLDGPHPDGPFRVYHQSFARFLADPEQNPNWPIDLTETNNAIVRALMPEGQLGARDWSAASTYVRRHLATHAAAAGRLDQLAVDPGFLLAAESKPLMSAIRSLASEDGRLAGTAYRLAHHRIDFASAGDRRSYLELAARRAGATALAGRISELPGAVAWEPTWATRRRTRTILTRHQGFAFALAVGTVDGETVALSGGPDGLVRAIELATSTGLGTALTDDGLAVMARPGQPVGAVAMCQVNGRPRAIASFSDGLVCATDLPFGSETIEIIAAHWTEPRDQWTLLASADRYPLVAVCEMDEVIHVLDLDASRVVAEPHHPGGVVRLAAGVIDGSLVLVSGGFDGTVRVWDFSTGEQLGKTLQAGSGQVHTLATTVVNSQLVIIASVLVSQDNQGYGHPGEMRAWDAHTGRNVPGLDTANLTPDRLGAAMVLGQPVLAVASYGQISLIDGHTVEPVYPDAHTDAQVIALAVADVDGRTAVVAGQDGGVVELIFPDEVARSADSADPASGSIGGARFAVDERAIAGGMDRGYLRLWDTTSGTALRVPGAGQNDAISSFDIAQAEARMVAVAASEAERITAWDIDSGELLTDLDATDAASQVTVSYTAGRTIIIGVGAYLRVWDMVTGQLLWQAALPEGSEFMLPPPRPLTYSGPGLSAVLWWDSSASQAWELFTGKRLAPTPRRHSLMAAAVATVRDQAIGLLGTEEGLVLTWDLQTGKRLHPPLKCGGGVDVLAIRRQDDEITVLASGGGLYEWNLADGRIVNIAYEGEWVSAMADVTLGNEKMLCLGFQSGRVLVPEANLALELDEPIDNIWGFSGDRILVATNAGIVAIHVTVQE